MLQRVTLHSPSHTPPGPAWEAVGCLRLWLHLTNVIYHQPGSIYYSEHRLQLQLRKMPLKPLIRIVTIAVLCCGNALFVYECDREKNSCDEYVGAQAVLMVNPSGPFNNFSPTTPNCRKL